MVKWKTTSVYASNTSIMKESTSFTHAVGLFFWKDEGH